MLHNSLKKGDVQFFSLNFLVLACETPRSDDESLTDGLGRE